MKLTKETLKQIIKEELEAVMSEAPAGVGQKTNVGSSRTQAYGDQTLGKTAAGQADRIFKAQQQTLQNIADNDRAFAANKVLQQDLISATNSVLNGASIKKAMKDNDLMQDRLKRDKLNMKERNVVGTIQDLVKASKAAAAGKSAGKAASDSAFEVGRKIRTKIYPFLKKNAGNLWKQSEASSEQEFLKAIEQYKDSDFEKLGSNNAQKSLKNLLGDDLYNSIMSGRSFGQKLGRFFTKGSFTEE